MADNPIQANPVVSLLLKSPLTPAQRRSASEAFSSAVDEDDLVSRMESLKLPKNVMADLWDLKAAAPAQVETPQGPQGSAIGRFASGAAEMLNPIEMVKGLVHTALHPIDTAGNILAAANAQREKAHEAQDRGDYGEMAARSVAAAIPVVGPMAADIGEQIGSGDVAGGLGKVAGMAAPMLVGEAVAAKGAPNPVKADRLAREAASTVADRVLAPGNPKYKAAAQKVAPELLKRGVQGDRVAVQQWADDLISTSKQAIDDALNTYPKTAQLPTAKAVSILDDALADMKFDGEVHPSLQSAYDELKTQRDFIAQRPTMAPDDLRRLRQKLDGIADRAGAFAKAKGDVALGDAGDAAYKAGNAVRATVAEQMPELSVPNADMHLGLAVKDILDPVKGRPKTSTAPMGVTGGLSTTGAIAGSVASTIPIVKSIAAFVASDLLPRIRNAQVSPENQLRLANNMYQLSESLKAGKVSAAQKALLNIGMVVPGVSGEVGRLTATPAGTTK